jgi:hypothetical protein
MNENSPHDVAEARRHRTTAMGHPQLKAFRPTPEPSGRTTAMGHPQLRPRRDVAMTDLPGREKALAKQRVKGHEQIAALVEACFATIDRDVRAPYRRAHKALLADSLVAGRAGQELQLSPEWIDKAIGAALMRAGFDVATVAMRRGAASARRRR